MKINAPGWWPSTRRGKMEREKYRTEQERVDNETMKIEAKNLIGSGYIQHPPQERNLRPPSNERFHGGRDNSHWRYNRRDHYFQNDRRPYRPRPYYDSSRQSGYYQDTGRHSYRPFRPNRGMNRMYGPPRGFYPPFQRPHHRQGYQRSHQNWNERYPRDDYQERKYVPPHFSNYHHQNQNSNEPRVPTPDGKPQEDTEKVESEVKEATPEENSAVNGTQEEPVA